MLGAGVFGIDNNHDFVILGNHTHASRLDDSSVEVTNLASCEEWETNKNKKPKINSTASLSLSSSPMKPTTNTITPDSYSNNSDNNSDNDGDESHTVPPSLVNNCSNKPNRKSSELSAKVQELESKLSISQSQLLLTKQQLKQTKNALQKVQHQANNDSRSMFIVLHSVLAIAKWSVESIISDNSNSIINSNNIDNNTDADIQVSIQKHRTIVQCLPQHHLPFINETETNSLLYDIEED